MNCLNCDKPLSGRFQNKYCSRSCATTVNNKNSPRKTLTNRCIDCGSFIRMGQFRCGNCYKNSLNPCIKLESNSNFGSNPYVRKHARKVYIKAGRPLACVICKYDKHVDVCHIKDIRAYPDKTLYSVVNRQENLIALCKNHHWEFDHDML